MAAVVVLGAVGHPNAVDAAWRITQLTDDDLYSGPPHISGTNVVWDSGRGSTGEDSTEIFLYDIDEATTTQLTNNNVRDKLPRVSSSNVVWLGYDGNDHEIFLYDIDQKTTTQLTNNNYDDRGVKVSGEYVMWMVSV